jgi:cytochrome c oxidase subunit 4
MASEQIAHGHHEVEHEEAHATPALYVRVALILAVITLVEVIIWYLPSVRGVLVPALLVLSLAKFLAVVGYFMHLKYDRPIFRFMFFAGLILALGVFLAMLAMFWTTTTFFPFIPG